MPNINAGPLGTFGWSPDPQGAPDQFSIGQSSSFGQGGSGSQNTSSASSFGTQFPDQVWGAQVPFFKDLYGSANQMMQGGGNQDQAQGLFNQGVGGFDQMMNPGVNPYLEAYAGDVQQNFTDKILPSIGRQAAGNNMVGGTRQGVAEGVAAGYANRDITNMGSKLYNDDMNRMMGAMGMMPQYGAFGMSIPWFGMNQTAGIMGSPTVLGQGGISGSTSESQGSSSAFDVSGSTGLNVSGPEQDFVTGISGLSPPPGDDSLRIPWSSGGNR